MFYFWSYVGAPKCWLDDQMFPLCVDWWGSVTVDKTFYSKSKYWRILSKLTKLHTPYWEILSKATEPKQCIEDFFPWSLNPTNQHTLEFYPRPQNPKCITLVGFIDLGQNSSVNWLSSWILVCKFEEVRHACHVTSSQRKIKRSNVHKKGKWHRIVRQQMLFEANVYVKD